MRGRGIPRGGRGVTGIGLRRRQAPIQRNWGSAMTRGRVLCFNCGQMNNAQTHFCGFCRTDMFMLAQATDIQCFTCGFVCRNPQQSFCGNCGDQL